MPPFQIPCKTFELMQNFTKPWYIAGGWAIDLFIGQQTRDHKDIEIAIYRQDQLTLQRYLSDWELVKIAAGQKLAWPPGEHLELPIHELHARSSNGEKLEILLNEHKNQKWQFRRHLSITRPLGQVGMKTNSGIPFLSPEIVLLYKSKNPRAEDEHDFENTALLLPNQRRAWLKRSIEQYLPGHDWVTLLS